MRDVAKGLSRRQLLEGVSCLSVDCTLSKIHRVPVLAADLTHDRRVSTSVLVDEGFVSVRKIGSGIYATISDPSKGSETTCNGGFLVGKDSAFLIEGFNSTAGASFQMHALRMVSRVPPIAGLNTHYHYDHSMGNAFYGVAGIPLWAHVATAKRMVEAYAPMQGAKKEIALAPFLERVSAARSDLERAHAQTDVNAMIEVFNSTNASVLGLPNHPLDPAALPISLDLGGLTALLEYHPGHSGTDIVVRVPAQNIVYIGDLLFNGKYPVCFDAQVTVSGWRETLKKFAALDTDTIFVPGHGPVCGQKGIAAIREIFDDIAGQAERMFGAGVPSEEAQHRYVVPKKFAELPIWSWGFTIGSAIGNLYKEWEAARGK